MEARSSTGATRRTYLVECYAPGIEQPAVEAAAARAESAVASLRAGGGAIEYLGAWLVASDEVVFHSFRAEGPELVHAASTSAALAFERIVESVGIGTGGSIAVPSSGIAAARSSASAGDAT
jgi:hypothetical protein